MRDWGLKKEESVAVSGPTGEMDNASASGAEDSRFESWVGRKLFCFNSKNLHEINPHAVGILNL